MRTVCTKGQRRERICEALAPGAAESISWGWVGTEAGAVGQREVVWSLVRRPEKGQCRCSERGLLPSLGDLTLDAGQDSISINVYDFIIKTTPLTRFQGNLVLRGMFWRHCTSASRNPNAKY